MAERRQALRFPTLIAFLSIRNSTQCTGQQIFPGCCLQIENCLEFVYPRSFRHRRQGLAGQSFSTSPDLIALRRIYTIALYVSYLIRLYRFYLKLCERGLVPPAWKRGPAPRCR
jgi:hypothetical protein